MGRTVNNYEDVELEWLLGDIGEIEEWVQPADAHVKEFDPQRARLFLEYFQIGMTERQACLEVPLDETMLRSWKRGNHGAPASFVNAYMKARDEQVHRMAEDIIDISDGTDRQAEQQMQRAIHDTNKFRKGHAAKIEKAIAELNSNSAGRIAARKWYVSKRLPQAYGDKVQLEHGGGERSVKVDVKNLTTEQLEKLAELDEMLKAKDAAE